MGKKINIVKHEIKISIGIWNDERNLIQCQPNPEDVMAK